MLRLLAGMALLPMALIGQAVSPIRNIAGQVVGLETAASTLDSLNATAVIKVYGYPYVGITLTHDSGDTLTVITEFSTDGGTTWDERGFFNGDDCTASDVLPHAEETIRTYWVSAHPADTHARLRVFAYTVGSISATVRASSTVPMGATVVGHCPWHLSRMTFDGVDTTGALPVGLRQNAGFVIRAGLTATVAVDWNPDSHGTTGWATAAFQVGSGCTTWYIAYSVTGSQTGISVPVRPTYKRLRLRVTSYSSGSAVVDGRSTNALDLISTATFASAGQLNCIAEVASGTADADAAIAAVSFLRLCGFAIKENAGTPAAAEVALVHGATVGGGTQIGGFHFDLAANEEVVVNLGPDCINVSSGVSVDRIAGTTKLSLFYKAVP